MDINSEIKTTLTAKDVAYLASASAAYSKYANVDEKYKEYLKNLTIRLGEETYSYPKNDFTK